jgi:hypothetical protein
MPSSLLQSHAYNFIGTKNIKKVLISGIPEIYTMKIRSSRRFLMVLSPALAVNNWCTYALYVAIEAMLNLHSKIICVVLQVWYYYYYYYYLNVNKCVSNFFGILSLNKVLKYGY